MTDGSLHDELKIPEPLQHLVQRPLRHELTRSGGFLLLEFNHQIYRQTVQVVTDPRTTFTDRYAAEIQRGIKVIAQRLQPHIIKLLTGLPQPIERFEYDA